MDDSIIERRRRAAVLFAVRLVALTVALAVPAAAAVPTSCPAGDPDRVFADDFERSDLCLWSLPADCATSSAIASVLSGSTPPVGVERALVTYLLPALGGDAAFFVQAEPEGPAVMVDVDPATLSPVPVEGDLVSFSADGVSVVSSQTRVTSISGWTILASLTDVDLTVDHSTTADLTVALDSYESEMTRLTATITGDFAFAGTGYESASIDTPALESDALLSLRVASALVAEAGLVPGCEVEICGTPLWRFGSNAQPLAAGASDYAVLACPAPRVEGAVALAPDTVRVAFDRPIDPASVSPDGSQFAFTGGLTASAAAPGPNGVDVTTNAMSVAPYSVSVAGSVADTVGSGIDPAHDEATFQGFDPSAVLVVNEVDYDQPGSDTTEFVELYNAGLVAVDLGSYSLQLVDGATGEIYETVPLPDAVLAAGDFFVVCGGTVANCDLDLTTDTNWLQNGAPDAVALTFDFSPTAIVDTVSYEGATAGYTEGSSGAPADPGSGTTSIGRCGDGVDTDDNSVDFFASESTPGAANSCS